jgi:hypothetical protein
MLQVFYLDVAYVAIVVHICCTSMFHMDVTCVSFGFVKGDRVLHMLQLLYMYVTRVCSKCFTCVWEAQAEIYYYSCTCWIHTVSSIAKPLYLAW